MIFHVFFTYLPHTGTKLFLPVPVENPATDREKFSNVFSSTVGTGI
jgi:hypothetical protein